jgi:hypothetical protein
VVSHARVKRKRVPHRSIVGKEAKLEKSEQLFLLLSFLLQFLIWISLIHEPPAHWGLSAICQSKLEKEFILVTKQATIDRRPVLLFHPFIHLFTI